MNNRIGNLGRRYAASLCLLALAAATPGGIFAQPLIPRPAGAEIADPNGVQTPETTMRDWPEIARSTARMMIEKYGEPNQFNEQALIWYNNGPWQETAVYREPRTRHLVMRDKDYLKQTVNYRVPSDKVAELQRFDKSIDVDTTRGEISSQSESENMNYLALNLAEEIAGDKRSVEDARAFYIKASELYKSGKESSYLNGLLPENHRPNDGY